MKIVPPWYLLSAPSLRNPDSSLPGIRLWTQSGTCTLSQIDAMYDSLVDRGANGGLAGSDIRLIVYGGDRTIWRSHHWRTQRLGKFRAVAKTKKGEVLFIFCQYAHIQRVNPYTPHFRWKTTMTTIWSLMIDQFVFRGQSLATHHQRRICCTTWF